jgi:hypothetical protein
MPDGWEVANRLNPLVADASADLDADGLSNLQEYLSGTDPRTFTVAEAEQADENPDDATATGVDRGGSGGTSSGDSGSGGGGGGCFIDTVANSVEW